MVDEQNFEPDPEMEHNPAQDTESETEQNPEQDFEPGPEQDDDLALIKFGPHILRRQR